MWRAGGSMEEKKEGEESVGGGKKEAGKEEMRGKGREGRLNVTYKLC